MNPWADPAEYAPPRPTLAEQPAAGNLGLLCYRVTELLAAPIMPAEWPLFRPFVQQFFEERFKQRGKEQ